MTQLQNNATVVGCTKLPDCLFMIQIRPDWYTSNIPWEPGQFIRIGILDDQHNERTLRAMTILSVEEGVFEFLMVAVDGGVTSSRLANLNIDDRCCVEPFITGNFHSGNLPDVVNKDLWMMGTGTGIAPYLSMLKNSESILRECENILLVHSVRQEQHLCSVEYISALQTRYPTLNYVPVVTREKGDRANLHNHIQTLLSNNSLSDHTGVALSIEHSVLLLCGQPLMIKESTSILKELGFMKHRRRAPGHILTERYF